MGSLNSKIIRLKAKEFNKLRAKMLPPGLKGYLLTKDGRTSDFVVQYELANWYPIFNNFREQMNIQVATEDENFVTALKVSSNLAYGVPQVFGATPLEVFEIAERDVIPPNGDRPWYQIFGTRTNEIYMSGH